MDCPHMTYEGNCSVTGVTTIPTQETCRACRGTGEIGINEVTVLYAIQTLEQEKTPIPEYLRPYVMVSGKRAEQIELDLKKGPGSLLKSWISWFITKPPDCTCDDRAELMNLWGKKECRRRLREILSWLRESALDNDIHYNEFVVTMIVKAAITLSRGKP